MRAWRMTGFVLVAVTAMALAGTVAAQAEDGTGRLIERPYTFVVEQWTVEFLWAGEVPMSGETSDFGGRCSVPSDWVYRARMEGYDSIFGPLTGHNEHCVQVVWGVDAAGAPAMPP